MKVFAVCKECEDYFYGLLAPDNIFKERDKAIAYAKELMEDDYFCTIKEYELE